MSDQHRTRSWQAWHVPALTGSLDSAAVNHHQSIVADKAHNPQIQTVPERRKINTNGAPSQTAEDEEERLQLFGLFSISNYFDVYCS